MPWRSHNEFSCLKEIRNRAFQSNCSVFVPELNKKQEVVSFILEHDASLQMLGNYINFCFSLMQSSFKAIFRGVATDFSGDWIAYDLIYKETVSIWNKQHEKKGKFKIN